MADLQVRRYVGREIAPLVPALAALRTAVFREFPYLYDGSAAYEEEYLVTYVDTAESLCVVVLDTSDVVGATTALPLVDADEAFQRPFREASIDPAGVFYFGESVLLESYRGRGLGHRFFDEREQYARELGRFGLAAFCAVERAKDDPRRPEGYRPLGDFWRRRGYERRSDLRTTFSWKETGETTESPKPMVFWIKDLS